MATIKKVDDDRRDFLQLTTTAMLAVGGASAVWPLIDSMNPAADTLAVAETEVNVSSVEPGQSITVVWQKKPVFIRHRTPKEINDVRVDNWEDLRDPESDEERTQKDEWLIMVGVCTHLGCIPLGNKAGQPKGDFGGWFCPCHGSHYDMSGRIRKGPAPKNLKVPPYKFTSDKKILIG